MNKPVLMLACFIYEEDLPNSLTSNMIPKIWHIKIEEWASSKNHSIFLKNFGLMFYIYSCKYQKCHKTPACKLNLP